MDNDYLTSLLMIFCIAIYLGIRINFVSIVYDRVYTHLALHYQNSIPPRLVAQKAAEYLAEPHIILIAFWSWNWRKFLVKELPR